MRSPGSNSASDTPWFLRVRTSQIAGIDVCWGLSTFAVPFLAFTTVGRTPAEIPMPFVGEVARGPFLIAGLAVLFTLYMHEFSHVIAARAVGMPVKRVSLETLIPAVEPEDDEDVSALQRFWFAAGGPIGDFVLGVGAVVLAWAASGVVRWLFIGYATGAVIQLMNAVPTVIAGASFVLAGVALMVGTGFGSVVVAPALALAGALLLFFGLVRGVRFADGDVALAAWRDHKATT